MPADVLRLATWNVNSIRARVDRVVDWLQRGDVDVLAMQETKCSDDQFPAMPFVAAGYEVVHCGFNQWNGVAIASRVGLDDVQAGFEGQPTWSKDGADPAAEARALGATCAGVRVWSLYVPNGRTLDDPHYRYKLEWLAALRDTAETWLHDDPDAPVARSATGTSRPPTKTSGTWRLSTAPPTSPEPERKAFNAIIDTRFTDVVRPYTPGPGCTPTGTTPSWRSRSAAECASTSSSAHRGWRDGWCTPRSSGRTPPGKKGDPSPSDHAPVLVDLRR